MSVLKRLREDGTWEFIGASSAGLPQVTSADNGKILKVENGIWNKADPPITGVSDVLCYLEKPLVDKNNNPIVDENGNLPTEKEWLSVVDENGDAYIPEGGLVDDVKVDGTSVVTNKIAEINLGNKESISNKVTSISSASTDTQYPSAKAVYTAVEAGGKVKDVTVNGESVLDEETGTAEIDIPYTIETTLEDYIENYETYAATENLYMVDGSAAIDASLEAF